MVVCLWMPDGPPGNDGGCAFGGGHVSHLKVCAALFACLLLAVMLGAQVVLAK